VLTVRLKPELYAKVVDLARHRGSSLNAMISEALETLLADAQDRELYEAATMLGSQPQDADIEWAFAAQREAIEALD